MDRDAEMRAVHALDRGRYHRHIIADGEARRRRGRHSPHPEEMRLDALVHFLVDQHGDELVVPHEAHHQPRARVTFLYLHGAAGHVLAQRHHPFIDERVVGMAIDLASLQSLAAHDDGEQFPIGKVTGHENAAIPLRRHRPQRSRIDDFDAVPLLGPREDRQMCVFGNRPAEIFPHVGDDALNLRFREIRHGKHDIAARPFRHAQFRSEKPRHRAAERGCTIETQDGKERQRCLQSGIFEKMDDAGSGDHALAALSSGGIACL